MISRSLSRLLRSASNVEHSEIAAKFYPSSSSADGDMRTSAGEELIGASVEAGVNARSIVLNKKA
jgi:hypothetical protein